MNELQGFLNQPFVPGMLAMACAPGLLLVLYIVFAYVRAARRVVRSSPGAGAPVAKSGIELLNQVRSAPDYGDDDLPPLDILLAPQPAATPAAPAPQGPRVIPAAPVSVQLSAGGTTRAKEVISILRDETDGHLLVLMGDKAYRSLVNHSEAKKEFTRVMKELSTVVMQAEPVTQHSAEAALEVPENPVAAAGEPPTLPTAGELLRAAPPVSTPRKAPSPAAGPLPGDLPSYKFDDNPATIQRGRLGVKKVEFVPPPTMDIPSAIEAYLQFRLAHSDEFQGREMHVSSAPGGGVRIRVDNDYYDFVDDITDPAAKAFIKQTIAEWQERQGN
jgi:hypothetical protein